MSDYPDDYNPMTEGCPVCDAELGDTEGCPCCEQYRDGVGTNGQALPLAPVGVVEGDPQQ